MKTFEKKRRVQEGNFHVYLRGNNRNTVFYDDMERIIFIKKLNHYATYYGVIIYAFVLMDNHVHLQIKTNRLSEFMKSFIQSFVFWYNRKNNTSGKLFCTPFGSAGRNSKSWQIDRILYILQNPVKHGACQHPSDYKWSSYHFHFNLRNKLSRYITLDTSVLNKEFKTRKLLDSALQNKILSLAEFKEDFSNTKQKVPDEAIIKQLKTFLNGKQMSTLTKPEMTDLIKFQYYIAGATIRQITSITHENYSFVTKILRENARN